MQAPPHVRPRPPPRRPQMENHEKHEAHEIRSAAIRASVHRIGGGPTARILGVGGVCAGYCAAGRRGFAGRASRASAMRARSRSSAGTRNVTLPRSTHPGRPGTHSHATFMHRSVAASKCGQKKLIPRLYCLNPSPSVESIIRVDVLVLVEPYGVTTEYAERRSADCAGGGYDEKRE